MSSEGETFGERSFNKLEVGEFGIGVMLFPQFMQTRRLARDDENLFAPLNNRSQVFDKRFEPSAKSFIVTKLLTDD